MKKTMGLILAMSLLTASITACGGSKAAKTEVGAQETADVVQENVETQAADEEGSELEGSDNLEGAWSDPGDGGIGDGYADRWFLFGDLAFESLTIHNDSTWEMRNPDEAGARIYCEGTSYMDEIGDLFLYELNGDEVGFATLSGDELTLVLTEDYEWTFSEYLSGDLVFGREGSSVAYEPQLLDDNHSDDFVSYERQPLDDSDDDDYVNGGSDPGDREIGNGYVDRWFLFGDLAFESLTIDENGAWEMRNPIDPDGSGGYIYCEGYAYMEENGDLALYELNGDEVGYAALNNDELTLVLTMNYEWTFENYQSGDLVFSREGASVSYEAQ